MSTLTVFYVKLLLVAMSSLTIWLGARADSFWEKIEKKQGGTASIGLGILVFRLIPFIIIYLVLNQMPRGDVPFFWGKATVAYDWKLVYRDFASYHAPLFAYIITLPIAFWYTPKAIVLLMVLIEAFIVWGTYRTYKNNTHNAFKSIMLYLMLSGPMIMVLLGGQEDIWLWGVAVWMLYYFQRTQKEGFGLGTRFSVGLLTIKATFVFWLFPLWLLLKKRWQFLWGMVVVGVPSLVVLYWAMGLDFLMPLQMGATNLLTPNLFTISRPWLNLIIADMPSLAFFSWSGMLITLSFATWIAYPAHLWSLKRSLPIAFLATYISMTFFQSTSVGYYAFTYMLPLLFELVDWEKRRDVAVLLFFNALLVVQPFLFTHLGSPTYDDISVLTQPLYLLEYTFQMLNMACYGWYLFKIYQKASANH